MTNRAQRRPLWHGVGRFLFFLTGSALLLLMVLFFGQSWWGALALTSAVIFVWAIVLIRSAWGALADGLMFLDRATGHRLLPARMLNLPRPCISSQERRVGKECVSTC